MITFVTPPMQIRSLDTGWCCAHIFIPRSFQWSNQSSSTIRRQQCWQQVGGDSTTLETFQREAQWGPWVFEGIFQVFECQDLDGSKCYLGFHLKIFYLFGGHLSIGDENPTQLMGLVHTPWNKYPDWTARISWKVRPGVFCGSFIDTFFNHPYFEGKTLCSIIFQPYLTHFFLMFFLLCELFGGFSPCVNWPHHHPIRTETLPFWISKIRAEKPRPRNCRTPWFAENGVLRKIAVLGVPKMLGFMFCVPNSWH